MWHHGCTATVLMHGDLHIKPHYSHVSPLHGSARGRAPCCCQGREGSITSCSSMQSPEAAERRDAQSKSGPRAIPEPSSGLRHHLAPQVLAPPPRWKRDGLHSFTCVSSMGSSHTYIETQLDYPLHPLEDKAALTPGAPCFTPCAQKASCPPPSLSIPQPCPSPPALRQPCLFAQGICSRGHLL